MCGCVWCPGCNEGRLVLKPGRGRSRHPRFPPRSANPGSSSRTTPQRRKRFLRLYSCRFRRVPTHLPAGSPAQSPYSPLPCTHGEGLGVRAEARFELEAPHPQPFSPEYRGEGSQLVKCESFTTEQTPDTEQTPEQTPDTHLDGPNLDTQVSTYRSVNSTGRFWRASVSCNSYRTIDGCLVSFSLSSGFLLGLGSREV